MPKNRKELIKKLIKEGFTHRTLSLFSDPQLKELGKKILFEQTPEKTKAAYDAYLSAQQDELDAKKDAADSVTTGRNPEDTTEDEEIEKVTAHNEPVIKIEKDGKEMTLLGDEEFREEAVSQKQFGFYQLVDKCKKSGYKDCGDGRNDNAVLKAAKSQSQDDIEDYTSTKNVEDLPTSKTGRNPVSEEEIIENWIMSLVEESQPAEISKSQFIKTIQETKKKYGNTLNKQKRSFKMVNEIANEMDPPMRVVVENIKGNIKVYLKSKSKVVELLIKECGEVQLDDIVVGEEELGEQAPLHEPTPTIAPPTTKPGERKRRGPFKVPNPNTNPKPKARDEKLPDWLTYDNLTT
jgi:hypothetical protein